MHHPRPPPSQLLHVSLEILRYYTKIDILIASQGRLLWGWDNQLDFLVASQHQPLVERLPQVVWRGRTDGPRYQLR